MATTMLTSTSTDGSNRLRAWPFDQLNQQMLATNKQTIYTDEQDRVYCYAMAHDSMHVQSSQHRTYGTLVWSTQMIYSTIWSDFEVLASKRLTTVY